MIHNERNSQKTQGLFVQKKSIVARSEALQWNLKQLKSCYLSHILWKED